jgi:type IV pilus assembly protein PilM
MARTLVGLDIGSSGVRAAEFTIGRRKVTLRKHASVPLPQGVVRAGSVVDHDALVTALKELWSKGGFGTRTVALGIANAGVLVRQMDLDWMPPADFRKALRYQVEDALPIPVDDANLDYHLLDELDVPGEGTQTRRVARVLLVAAAREAVDGFVEATHRAGLRAVSVDIVPFALLRARAAGRTEGPAEAEAIVDIGTDTVTVVVHAGGVPRYVRMVTGVGGEPVTQAVMQRYDWTWEDAERTKIFVGLPGHAQLDPAQLESLGPRDEGLEHAAQQVVAAAVEGLVAEIGTTLDYYRGSASDTPPQEGREAQSPDVVRVLLAGSGARLGGLPELLASRLGVTVEPLVVNDQVRTSRRARGDADLASLAVPAGLCVGGGR